MTDAHTQEVTITVTDGDKSATFRSTREHNWPGSTPPHISRLIDETAGMAKAAISGAENPDKPGLPAHKPGYRGR